MLDSGMTVPYSDRLKSRGRIPAVGRTKPPGLPTSALDPGIICLPVSSARRTADSIHLSISLRRNRQAPPTVNAGVKVHHWPA